MTHRLRNIGTLLLLAAVIGGCASTTGSPVPPSQPAAQPAPATATSAPTAPASAAPSTPEPASAAPSTPEPAASPLIDAAWAQAELTDAATGESFRIADLAGKVVILETMAIWCTNCLAQQGDVYSALDDLDPERVAYVLLDVDPNETEDALARYRSQNGFSGTYAIAGREVARALADDFGDQVLNPPSTPMILIGTDGRVTLTDFGHKSPDTVMQLARDHGA